MNKVGFQGIKDTLRSGKKIYGFDSQAKKRNNEQTSLDKFVGSFKNTDKQTTLNKVKGFFEKLKNAKKWEFEEPKDQTTLDDFKN